MTTIEINDLPAQFTELLLKAATGHEIIVTENGVQRARLLPVAKRKERIFDLHPGSAQMSDDFDDPLPESFWTGEV